MEKEALIKRIINAVDRWSCEIMRKDQLLEDFEQELFAAITAYHRFVINKTSTKPLGNEIDPTLPPPPRVPKVSYPPKKSSSIESNNINKETVFDIPKKT